MTSKLLRFFVFGTLLLSVGVAQASKQIQVKGSDTEVNLVQILAEKFMAKNKEVNMSVTGGGSGTGIAALFNKTADLANSSRAMKDDEMTQAKQAGLVPKRIIFATDALSVIVHDGNPVKSLTVDQVGKIFRGEIKNWKDLGGKDEPISLYGRQSNSGTFVFFREFIVKSDYSPDMKGMNGNSQIVEGVGQDKGGVGYVGIGYALDTKTRKPVKGIQLLKIINPATGIAVDPTDETSVVTGKYPIARPLYQYFVNSDPHLVGFLKFELGAEGRKLITKEGFYEIKKEWKAENDKVLKELVQH